MKVELGKRIIELYNCKTKKDLILKLGEVKKECVSTQEIRLAQKVFHSLYDELDMPKGYDERLKIQKTFYQLAIEKPVDKDKILAKCDELNISFFTILNLFDQESMCLENNMKSRINFARVLYKLRELAIENQIQEDVCRDFEIAKTVIKMHVDSGKATDHEFFESIKMTCATYMNYRNILKTKEHPIYIELQELKKKMPVYFSETITDYYAKKNDERESTAVEKIKSSSKEELKKMISSSKIYDFGVFCRIHNMSPALCTQLLEADKNFLNKLIDNIENIEKIYKDTLEHYEKQLFSLTKSIIINTSCDLFSYYEQFGTSIKILERIALNMGYNEEAKIISTYINLNFDKFAHLNKCQLTAIAQKRVLTSGNETINFSQGEFSDAIDEINKKDYPMCLGVVFGAIKSIKQKKNEEIQKVMKKTKQNSSNQ